MLGDGLMLGALNLLTRAWVELARVSVESVSDPLSVGIHRIEAIAAGRVAGLTEAQYRLVPR